MKLYTMRYKQGYGGVITAYLAVKKTTGDPAKDLLIAQQIGQTYCNREPNRKYIHVVEAIIADESILNPALLESIRNPPQPKEPVFTPEEEAELEDDSDMAPELPKKQPEPANEDPEEDDEEPAKVAQSARQPVRVAKSGKRGKVN